MTDRLTERNPYWLGNEFWVSAKDPDDEEIDRVYEKLKHYEDEEEQGLLLRLPCKIGDTVYINNYCKKSILKTKVGNYRVDGKNHIVSVSFGDLDGNSCIAPIWNVFLTREEAEAKLAEMEGK